MLSDDRAVFLSIDSIPQQGFTMVGKDGCGSPLGRGRGGRLSPLHRLSRISLQQGRMVLQRKGDWEDKQPCSLKAATHSI